MRGGLRFLAAVAAALTLLGCATPTTQRVSVSASQTAIEAQKQIDLAVEEQVSDLKRIKKIHWELAIKGVAMCPKTTAAWGAEVRTKVKGPMGESMERVYGVGSEPTVLFVLDGTPAQKAGLQARDHVVSIYGISTGDAKSINERQRRAGSSEPMPVVVRRGGKPVTLSVKPELACDYPITLEDKQIVNAFADGERIIVTRGMVAFARTDDELALVIAHEFAHNTMKHMDAKRQNAAGGLVADIALTLLTRGAYRQASISDAAGKAYSQEFEAEADYVGLYMLANTSYSVEDAPKFWRRMAAANPANIVGSHAASHPSTSYRMVALEETVKEVNTKRVSGVALLPERKDGKTFAAGEGLTPSAVQEKQDANCFLGTDGKCNRR